MKGLNKQRPWIEARGREEAIADHLFRNSPNTDWSNKRFPWTRNDTSLTSMADRTPSAPPRDPSIDISLTSYAFSAAELDEACKRLPSGKACSSDVIPTRYSLAYTVRDLSSSSTCTIDVYRKEVSLNAGRRPYSFCFTRAAGSQSMILPALDRSACWTPPSYS